MRARTNRPTFTRAGQQIPQRRPGFNHTSRHVLRSACPIAGLEMSTFARRIRRPRAWRSPGRPRIDLTSLPVPTPHQLPFLLVRLTPHATGTPPHTISPSLRRSPIQLRCTAGRQYLSPTSPTPNILLSDLWAARGISSSKKQATQLQPHIAGPIPEPLEPPPRSPRVSFSPLDVGRVFSTTAQQE